MPNAHAKPYRVVAISLYLHEAAEADRLTETLRRGGWPKANRSLVIREALLHLVEDELAGKTPEEIFRYFLDRLARRAGQTVDSPLPQR